MIWNPIEELREALETESLQAFDARNVDGGAVPADARLAALRVAIALGRCRQQDVVAGEDDGTLPVPLAHAAATALVEQLRHARARAEQLPERAVVVTDEDDPLEAEMFAESLLEARLDSWAAFIAIDESYEAALTQTGRPPEFDQAFTRLLDDLKSYEQTLRQQRDYLVVVADSPLLAHWRANLKPPFREALEGWIDETFQGLDEQFDDDDLLEMIPDAPSWERIRKAALRTESDVSIRTSPSMILPFPRSRLPEPVPAVLASARAETERALPQTCYWDSPDRTHFARLEIPARLNPGEDPELLLQFGQAEGGAAASDLVGNVIHIAGLERQIETPGLASVRLSDLRATGRDLSLEVAGAAWTPRP